VEVKIGIAMYYYEIREYDKALDVCRKLVYEFPQDERPYYTIGYVYYEMDSVAKAKRNFEHAITVEPTYVLAHFMLGQCAERVGDFETAKKFYGQTLNLRPDPDLARHATEGYERVAQKL
jgi:Tfp pilus assembly protein PilF